MRKILALKVDVDTYRGTREGVPRLLNLLQKVQAEATFYFSLGPDQMGRAIKKIFRPGFMKKVSRTSVLDHYGFKTLLYGTLLPSPNIGKKCADIMRKVQSSGHEVGIHVYNHIRWQDNVIHKGFDWTQNELMKAFKAYQEVFQENAHSHAAAGWQVNDHALMMEEILQFDYCSDTRGTHPFIPVIQGNMGKCPQIPTTLPTLDELIGSDDLTEENVHTHLLKLTGHPLLAEQHGHVYTLHAELEGMKLLPVLERLIAGWKDQGYELVPMRTLFQSLDLSKLPYHEIILSEFPGRSGVLAVQKHVNNVNKP